MNQNQKHRIIYPEGKSRTKKKKINVKFCLDFPVAVSRSDSLLVHSTTCSISACTPYLVSFPFISCHFCDWPVSHLHQSAPLFESSRVNPALSVPVVARCWKASYSSLLQLLTFADLDSCPTACARPKLVFDIKSDNANVSHCLWFLNLTP